MPLAMSSDGWFIARGNSNACLRLKYVPADNNALIDILDADTSVAPTNNFACKIGAFTLLVDSEKVKRYIRVFAPTGGVNVIAEPLATA
jgi:hypothetical protein